MTADEDCCSNNNADVNEEIQACGNNTNIANQEFEANIESETINSGPEANPTDSQKPLDTAFRQQRLPAWRPILTPQNVIPILFAIGVFFIPLGVLFLISSAGIQEYAFDYTNCLTKATNTFTSPNANFQWRNAGNGICEIRFNIDHTISGPVYLYYGLTNYYQNNRLYVKSVSFKQMAGSALTKAQLQDYCEPLVGPPNSNKVYYPCGLIANSYFNDVYFPLVKEGDPTVEIEFLPNGIAWNADSKLYKPTQYQLNQIAPPPSWKQNSRWVDANGNYKEIPRLWEDERFQVWMRVAALPAFRKLYGKYDFDINPGTYLLRIQSNYDTKKYNGTKSVHISTVSWIGGKNTFLGVSYLIVGGVCVAIGLFFLLRHLLFPRLWEQQQAAEVFQDPDARDSADGTVQALYVLEEMDKKMFRCVFPIHIKETEIVRGPPLGDGSFGVVYTAKVAKNNNRLAVKVSNKFQYTKIEYLALKKLDSRYFPKVYFFGIVKYGPNRLSAFFGMEILKGSDMFQIMQHYDSSLSGEYLRYVAAQLLVAVSLLHKKGYIHRDIKPENVMCCDNGTIKLIDFGGCLPAANDKVIFKEWFGTEEYMAPEQLNCIRKEGKNCAYTRLADWWAAGATIYYAAMFTDIKRGKPIQTDNANLTNLVNRLCSNNPAVRKFDYKKHPYFKGFNWKKTD